jgi:hypothetical protein
MLASNLCGLRQYPRRLNPDRILLARLIEGQDKLGTIAQRPDFFHWAAHGPNREHKFIPHLW